MPTNARLEVVVILIAQRTSAGIDHVRHSQIRGDEVVKAQDGIHLEGARAGVAPVVAPTREARSRLARAVAALLPRGVLRVDKEVVHEEGRVLGGGPDVPHDGTDGVVARGVGPVGEGKVSKVIHEGYLGCVWLVSSLPGLETPGELAYLVDLGAPLDVVRGDLGGDGLISGTRQTVHRIVVAPRPNVAHLVREPPVGDAELVVVVLDGVGQRAKVLRGEDAALVEAARVEGLVPPRQGPVEAALAAQQGLKGRHEGAVPGEEDLVAEDGVGEDLVGLGEVLPPALEGGKVLAGRGLLGQARDGIDEGFAVAGRVVTPLDARGEGGTACGIGSPGRDRGA